MDPRSGVLLGKTVLVTCATVVLACARQLPSAMQNRRRDIAELDAVQLVRRRTFAAGPYRRAPGGMIVLIHSMALLKLHTTVGVKVGPVQVGGGAPVVVQSMTNTDTPDVESTARQCIELAQAGSELVRITVNIPE